MKNNMNLVGFFIGILPIFVASDDRRLSNEKGYGYSKLCMHNNECKSGQCVALCDSTLASICIEPAWVFKRHGVSIPECAKSYTTSLEQRNKRQLGETCATSFNCVSRNCVKDCNPSSSVWRCIKSSSFFENNSIMKPQCFNTELIDSLKRFDNGSNNKKLELVKLVKDSERMVQSWQPLIMESFSWSLSFSDENKFSGVQTSPIAGIWCKDGFCDNKQLKVNTSMNVFKPGGKWTKWFSDENNGRAFCNASMNLGPYVLVQQIACNSGYCDDLRLQCAALKDNYRLGRQTSKTGFFSDEQGAVSCPPGFYVYAIACQGSYCDDINLYCVQVEVLA